MSRRLPLFVSALALIASTAAFVSPLRAKWPPWVSIESPVNPFDPWAHNAALLVHATFREGPSQLADVTGRAEGILDGARKTLPLRFDSTDRPNVFALRRQWPAGGTWLLRIVVRTTTAIVTLDRDGNVASVRVPTATVSGNRIPRAVSAHEIDSTLTELAKR